MVTDSHYARWSYASLLIGQPQVTIDGLFEFRRQFYIQCPNLATELADDGRPIAEWFRGHKVLGSPVALAAQAPTGAVLAPN